MSRSAIEAALPHGPSMVLIDSIVETGEGRITCRARARNPSAFASDGDPSDPISSTIALELIAQAAALFQGPKIARGFVVSVRDFKLARPHVVNGADLEIEVTAAGRAGPAFDIRGSITENGSVLATASVTLYRESGR